MTFISILLGIILIIAIVMAVLLTKTAKPSTWKPFVKTELQSIVSRTNTHDPVNMKAAVIDLDSLLDHAFKGRHTAGSTMGERLKMVKGVYPKDLYNNIWEAHKLRNKLAHEPMYRPQLSELQSAVSTLKSAISTIVAK